MKDNRKRKKSKESFSQKFAKHLDLPTDVFLDIPRITILDNTEIRIENYKTVLEYEENKIQFACKTYIITVTGQNLAITLITDDEVGVCGLISSVSFS